MLQARYDKQDSLMRGDLCGKLHGWSTVAIIARTSRSHRSDSQILAENRDFCLPHLHSMPTLGGPVGIGICIASRGKNYAKNYLALFFVDTMYRSLDKDVLLQ